LCVFLLISATACHSLDRSAFAGVEHASNAIQAAIDGKATLSAYRELLVTYAAELLRARERVTTQRDRAVWSEYEAALKGLTDVRLIWEEKEARGSELLPIRDEVPGRIAREYDLGINTNEPPSIYAGEAMETIWKAARAHLLAASRLLIE
jgi:hypothetical protein